MSEELFRPIFVPDKFREAVSGRAWLGALLEPEGALAHAEAKAGLIPPDAADEVFAKRRQLVGLLVEGTVLRRNEAGQTSVEITYCFGPPDAPSEEHAFAVGDQYSW